MKTHSSFKNRVQGPNEKYAEWNLENVDFDRRSTEYEEGAIRSIKATDYKVSRKKYSRDFLEHLPAEPFFIRLAKIIGKKKNFEFATNHYHNIRHNLLDSNIVNYKLMKFIKYDGAEFNTTPYFLNAFGKYYYQAIFNTSADTMAKGFYRDKIISNRDFAVRHLYHIRNFYENKGHEVVVGQYPFDLIVDGKHGFIQTEMHENSIGIEMRLSEAIFQGLKKGIKLYLPSMTVEHRNRNCGIMAGLLFEYGLPSFSYACYLEPEICSDTKINDWSYFITKKNVCGENGKKFVNPLPFPKINLSSSKLVATQLTKINERRGTIHKKNVNFQFSLIFVNSLNEKEVLPGIKVTAGYGQIRDIWQEMATGSDILMTSKIRMNILDNLEKLPKLMIINEFDVSESSEDNLKEETHKSSDGKDAEIQKKAEIEVYRALKRNNVEIMMLPRNHAKAVLNGYKLMIHSMPTTHYMGNNRESFGIIDFSGHPERDEIHAILHDMLIAFGSDDPTTFIYRLKKMHKYFKHVIEIFGHFSGKRTVEWVYYRKLVSRGRKRDYTILTSHIYFEALTEIASTIRIQGVSRSGNHKSLMKAKCPVIKERMWHPRLLYNKNLVALGSWDFARIEDQKELQMIIYT